MKNVINSFSRDLWLSNLTEGWLMIKSHMSNNKVTYPSDHVVTWSHETNELHDIFILRSLLPLYLTGWWFVKLKSNYGWFFFFLSKFWLRGRYFIPKALLFFYQFYQFPEKHLCAPSCFKNLDSQSGKKFLIRNLNHDLQNISNWK